MTKKQVKKGRNNTYLTHACRLPQNVESPDIAEKRNRSFQPTMWLSSAVEEMLAGSPVFLFILSDFLCSAAICRHDSGRCHPFLPFLTYFCQNNLKCIYSTEKQKNDVLHEKIKFNNHTLYDIIRQKLHFKTSHPFLPLVSEP